MTTTVNGLVISFANVDTIASMISAETYSIMDSAAQAKATLKRGSAHMLWHLYADFGKGDREQGKEVLTAFPIVGTKAKDGINTVCDLNPVPGVKKDGTPKEDYVSIFAMIWDVSDVGKAHYSQVEKHKALKDTAEDSQIWTDEMSRLTAERSNSINKFKEAMKLHQKIGKVNDYITNADARLHLQGEGDTLRPVNGANSVILSNLDTKAQKAYTCGQFLSLNLDKAISNGANYAALVATTGKGSGDGPKTFIPEIEKIEQWDQVTAEYAAFSEKMVNDAKLYKALLTHLNQAGSDVTLLSLDAIKTRLETILGLPTYSNRLEALLEAGENMTTARRKQLQANLQATG